MVMNSVKSRTARIVAAGSAVGALACGIGTAPAAVAAERPSSATVAGYSAASALHTKTTAKSVSAGGQERVSTQGRYQCITRNNTPLYYNGVILNWANAGQGLYDVRDFGDSRVSGKLWGGGGTSYKIDRWYVGWCG